MSYGIDPQDPQNPQYSPANQASHPDASAGGQYGMAYPTGSQPGEPVGFVGAIKNFFRKYAQFSGRASLSEFWWWRLAWVLLTLVLLVIFFIAVSVMINTADAAGNPTAGGITFYLIVLAVIGIINLALIIPDIALTVRRLHDTNKPGWFYFLMFIPVVGPIIVLVLCAAQPDPAGAAFDA